MKVIALGEVMMRLSTPSDNSIYRTDTLNIFFGGGEYNTLVNLAQLDNQVAMITNLPDNPLSKRILSEMNMYNVDTNFVNITPGRLGTYYTLLGDDVTATKVIYDRENSAFYHSKDEDYDFTKIFKGYDLFHVSGITPALNTELQAITINAIKQAHKLGLKVSYDSNYRAKLWSQEAAGKFLKSILPFVDYAFLGILDMKYLLNMEVTDLETGYKMLKEEYPNIKLFASTNRTVISTNKHFLSVNVYDNHLVLTKEVEINVKDRIGGGDAFTAGVLDGIIHNKSTEDIALFALYNAVIKHYRLGDNMFITRDEVNSLLSGSSLKIQR